MKKKQIAEAEQVLKEQGYSIRKKIKVNFLVPDVVAEKGLESAVVEARDEKNEIIEALERFIIYKEYFNHVYLSVPEEKKETALSLSKDLPFGVIAGSEIIKESKRFEPQLSISKEDEAKVRTAETKRLFQSTTIGNLWLYLLRELSIGPRHAYALKTEIAGKYGFSPGRITVYKVLYLLKKHKMVAIEKKEGERKYYTITKKGIETLKEGIQILRERAEALE